MLYQVLKVAISAILIVLVSEVSKRSSTLGGLLASLPLVSYLGMIWLYVDTGDLHAVTELSRSIFWLVLPSLSLFIAFPLLARHLSFAPALGLATVLMVACYGVTVALVERFGLA